MKKLTCMIFDFIRTCPARAAILFSAAMLAGAWSFEMFGGYVPCDLCWTQRYAHMGVIGLGVFIIILHQMTSLPARFLDYLMVPALWAAAGVGAYHAGVEYKWWQGPTDCTAQTIGGNFDPDQFLQALQSAPIVSCDEVVWELFGISMAGYNFLFTLGMGLLILAALTRKENG
ncbi:disulfide bond formation protein B [Emcibacter nanhaiensis]|uniref:Disulfide bond formation protein B n=1 Tax=Emcibacter nanhaiensis TaxID=1505037 RepID=A0A501PGZ2_9PROT|nr:disulfide bond formation protein B [Emcibacter nanhaiensis]TPD59347.1 disulfide bond formation protein B [Emcibacter nanhaiensis]